MKTQDYRLPFDREKIKILFVVSLQKSIFSFNNHLREAPGRIRAIRSMASQKLLTLDTQNRIVASAIDPQAAAEFAIQSEDGTYIHLQVFIPASNTSNGEWKEICPSSGEGPYFVLCNQSDSRIVHVPQRGFKKVCYSHWHGIPEHSGCDVFGLQYDDKNEQFLTVDPIHTSEREGLLRANGGKYIKSLGVNDYHKTFMFVNPKQPDDSRGQRFLLNQIELSVLVCYTTTFQLRLWEP